MQNSLGHSNHRCRFDGQPRKILFFLCCFLVSGTSLWSETQARPSRTNSSSRAVRSDQSAATKTFDINKEYGTLAFRGSVERSESGDEYEFLAQIELTFLPGETRNGYTVTNRTAVADLTTCALVATVYGGGKEPAEILYRESYPITIHLTQYGETAWLPDLRFHLDKSIAARATHIGLTVSDGRLLWPIAVELK